MLTIKIRAHMPLFFAFIGAVTALALLGKLHDRQFDALRWTKITGRERLHD